MSQPDEMRRCAICGNPQTPEYRPFCSKRCANIDLGRWLKGNYVIPGRQADEGDGPQAPPATEDRQD